jgi:4-amino-4-deoxy-L-arabinose transferase-like glycosyltransferase
MSQVAEETTVRWSGRQPATVAVALAVALALVLRVGVLVATPDFKPTSDAADFNRLARSIADTGHYPDTSIARPGTPTALNPPGYPHLLGLTYEYVGRSLTTGRALGVVLGTVTVLLLALIAWRLWGPAAGAIAGFLGAVYPPLVLVNASLISETLFVPLLLGVVLLLVAWRRAGGSAAWAMAAAAGVLCGLAALTRFVGVLLAVVVLVWIWRQGLTARRRLAMSALVVLAASATIAPWTLRNARAFHSFVPIATEGGAAAVGTYNPDSAHSGSSYALWRPAWQISRYRGVFNDGLDEAQLDRRWRSDALHYARQHPTYTLAVASLNSLRMFGLGPGHHVVEHVWYDEMGIPRRAQPWTRLSVYLMTLLALVGIIVRRPWRRPGRHVFLWITPLLLFVTAAFVVGGPRYRVPIDPFLVLAATGGVIALAPSVRRVLEPASATGLGG